METPANYTDRLKSYWKSDRLIFIATYSKYKGNTGFFDDFINPVSKKKLYYPEIDNIEILNKQVSLYYRYGSRLNDGDLYKVELEYNEKSYNEKNPYSLTIKRVTKLDQTIVKNHLDGDSNEVLLRNVFQIKSFIKKNASKEHIRLRFERLNNPEANKIIANLMREIGKGMYSSKQRMIFELLQNADDAPGKEKVEFHIDVKGDYFFVMHDGAVFSKNDVDAITSAAESTKRNDKKKTGYKGIGFKSVFTDSTEVWLKSGAYQFAFIRNSPLFEDFESFYFSSSDYIEYPKLKERHKKKYHKDILTYNSSTDIPWQVIPIWQDNLPEEFNDSNFNNFNNPVQFALKVGQTNIYSEDGYLAAIDNIVKRPQFLLFLRNTSKFRSPKNRVTVARNVMKHSIEIEKSRVIYNNDEPKQQHEVFNYTKQVYTDIEVSDSAFSKLNIGIKKAVEKNELNEDTYHFVDLEGNKIETIPPKLASANNTQISFGISLVDNRISPEKEYISGLPKYSSLFTYLPMEDTRFQLPFLVNADFVPSSDRQKIQGDNLWNKYIMIKVAERHVKALSFYAEKFKKDNDTYSSYLSLLLKNPLPDDDTAQQIIESYNQNYKQQLENERIIVNDEEQTQLLSETIIDDSGIIELLGHDIFYEIIDTDKRLPHSKLDVQYLKSYEYLNIEIIDLNKLAEGITPEICERIGNIIKTNSLYNKPELVSWLNMVAKYLPENFGKIPFVHHNNDLHSIEDLLKEQDAWLITKNTENYEKLLTELGYHTINLQLEKYLNINNYLLSIKGYINDKTLAYDRISNNSKLSELDISLKLDLIVFLKSSEFMKGIGDTKYFGELKLFVDENGTARPLRQLISRKENIDVASIQNFRISANEYSKLTEDIAKELVQKNKLFTSFILNKTLFNEWSQQFNSGSINSYVVSLKAIYGWKNEDEEILPSKWAEIPWLYIDDELRFCISDNIFWSSAFSSMSDDDYLTIKDILHPTKIKTLPFKECGSIIQDFKLKTEDSSDIDWTKVTPIETLSANTLLDWIERDGINNNFFEKYTLKANAEGKWKIHQIDNIKIFGSSNIQLKNYIESIDGLKVLFSELDEALYSNSRYKIGLLQGDSLLNAIIDSKAFDQQLATLLPSNVPLEQLKGFILNLSVFNLKTGVEYNNNSPEHIIINNLLRSVEDINAIPEDLQVIIENLRGKIEINNNPLAKYNISDRVTLGNKENRKVLKLSDILEEFQGDSDELENVKESFISINQKEKLRKLIFKTRQLKIDEIHTKIEAEKAVYYNPHQVVFQLLYKKNNGNKKWAKQHFDDFWKEQGNELQVHTSYKLFLDILIEIDYSDLSGFSFLDLDLKNCVDKNYAIESEIIPGWLDEWISIDPTKRIEFISKLGYNGINSPVVKLRKATISENYDSVVVIGHYSKVKSNPQIASNTIDWLSSYNSRIITNNIGLIKQINEDITKSENNSSSLIIPIITSINEDGKRSYILQNQKVKSNLHYLLKDEAYAYEIFTAIKKNDKNALITDDSVGNTSSHFNAVKIQLTEGIDSETLTQNSTLWDEPYYEKWEHYNECSIYIYAGKDLPHKRLFKDITINTYSEGLINKHDGAYYVSSILRNSILTHEPPIIPVDKLQSLKDWRLKVLEDPALLEDNPYEESYNETFDRMIQDRYGISKEKQNDENSNAKRQALYFLEEEGFDVDSGSSQKNYSALYDIIDPDGSKVTCIVRSAKGGLLYLDKKHWDMLENNQTYLIVIYPGNSPRLFKDRLELLNEELAENVLFRFPNRKITNKIDGVFGALESESHLILVTSEKMKESLFSKLKKKDNFQQEKDAAIKGDNFSFN